MSVPAHLRRMYVAFGCAGILLCGLCVGVYLEARYYQALGNRRLEEELRRGASRENAAGPRRGSSPRRAGTLVGRLEIPRLRISAIVLEGSDGQILERGVGHLPETAEPGQEGNMVLGGHRDTFFRPLRQIRRGDRVTLVTAGAPYRYVVEWTEIVDPSDTAALKTTSERSLTLVTCYPFHYVGPAPRRFIVRARQVAPAAANTASD